MKSGDAAAMEPRIPTNSEINRRIAIMILPITIEGILQMTSGIISMGMVGRINVTAVSALGISMQITQLIWALCRGLAIGETVFVAQYYGAQRQEEMRYIIQQTLISVIITTSVLMVAVYFSAEHLLSIFDPRPELMAEAASYMKTACFGFPFLAVMLIIAGSFQGRGNSHTPMMITLLMNVVNIVIAYVLIFGKLGFSPMGVRGAAVALVFAQMAAAVTGLVFLFRKKGILHEYCNRKFFHIDIRQIIRIYRVGLQSAMEMIFWLLAGIIVARCIMSFGETTFAAHQLGVQAESISYMPASGFGIAATAFIGQALGSDNGSLAKRYLRQILKGSIIITSVSVAVLLLFPEWMMKLLTNNAEVIKLGAIYLIITGLVQLQQNGSGVLQGAMRGAGYTKVPMIVAGAGLWGVRVPLTLLFTYALHLSIVAIWIAMGIDLTFRFILNIFLFKKYNIYNNRFLK